MRRYPCGIDAGGSGYRPTLWRCLPESMRAPSPCPGDNPCDNGWPVEGPEMLPSPGESLPSGQVPMPPMPLSARPPRPGAVDDSRQEPHWDELQPELLRQTAYFGTGNAVRDVEAEKTPSPDQSRSTSAHPAFHGQVVTEQGDLIIIR